LRRFPRIPFSKPYLQYFFRRHPPHGASVCSPSLKLGVFFLAPFFFGDDASLLSLPKGTLADPPLEIPPQLRLDYLLLELHLPPLSNKVLFLQSFWVSLKEWLSPQPHLRMALLNSLLRWPSSSLALQLPETERYVVVTAPAVLFLRCYAPFPPFFAFFIFSALFPLFVSIGSKKVPPVSWAPTC